MHVSEAFWEIAEQFVEYIHRETGLATIVCDDRGVIKKAYVKTRIGQPHAGSQKILSSSIKQIAISAEDEKRNPLTKEGLNYAVVVDGKKVATFGITGKLELVTPVAIIAAKVLAQWLKQLEHRELLHSTANEVQGKIRTLNQKIESVIEQFESVSQSMSGAAAEASKSVTTSGQILGSVNQIGLQTRLLSFNASIEAGRLGEQGRPFAAIAEEMQRLSLSAQEFTQTIQRAMDDIRHSVDLVNVASKKSSVLFAENVATLRDVTPVVNTLVSSIAALEHSFDDDRF